MALATLSIDLEARLAKFTAGFTQAQRQVEAAANRMESRFRAVNSTVNTLAGSLAAAFAGVSLVTLVRNTVDGIDALNDFADAVGTTVEQASRLEDRALRTGTSMEVATTAAIKLNQVLASAKPDSETARALQSIGLDAEKLRRMDPVDALVTVGQALNGYADTAEKGQTQTLLLGRSVGELAPLLRDLANEGLGVVTVTADQAEQAEKFNRNIAQLQTTVVGFARDLASVALPALNGFLDKLRQAANAGNGSLFDGLLGRSPQAKLQQQAQAISADIVRLVDRIERETEAQTRRGGAGVDAFADQRLTKARDRLTQLQRDAAVVSQQLKDLASQVDTPATPAAAGAPPPTRRIVPIDKPDKPKTKTDKPEFVGPEVPPSLEAALKRLEGTDVSKVRELREELARLQAILAAPGGDKAAQAEAIAQVNDELARLDPAVDAALKRIEGTDVSRISDLRAELGQLQSLLFAPGSDQAAIVEAIQAVQKEMAALDPVAKAAADRAERLKNLLADIPSAEVARVTADVQLLREEFDAGRISEQQYVEAVRQRMATTSDLAKDLGLSFSSAFEDAIVEGKGLRDVLAGLYQDILRILTRKAITEPLANAVGSIDFGSIFGSIFGRARGGPVAANGIYQVNEEGPEIAQIGGRTYLLPGQQGGFVRPVREGSTGAPRGRSVVVNQVQVINNASSQATVRTESSPNGLRVIIDQVRSQLGAEIAAGQGLAQPIAGRFGLNPAARLAR
jgi:hypothetical protein